MKQIDLREGARRQHRAVSLFAVIQCWLRQLDGVAFQRSHLERLLGLGRFKQTRINWLKEDFHDFFPYCKVIRYARKNNSLASVIVSRVPFQNALPKGTMTTEKRIEGITAGGPRLALFELWETPSNETIANAFEGIVPFFSDSANFDERFLSSYLSLLVQGQISPKRLPPLKAGSDAQ